MLSLRRDVAVDAGLRPVSVPVRAVGTKNPIAKAWLIGLVSIVAFSLSPVAAAVGLQGGVPSTVQVTLRCLIGAAVLLTFALVTGRLRTTKPSHALGVALFCGPIFGLQLLAFFVAVRDSGAQLSTIVVHCYPMIVLALLWLGFGQRVPRGQIVLGVLMIGGLALVLGSDPGKVAFSGVVYALASAFGYALYFVIAERWIRRTSAVTAAGLTALGAGVTVGIFVVIDGVTWSFAPIGWASVLMQGLVLLPLAIGCSLIAIRTLGSGRVSLLGLLDPVLGVLAAQVVLGETLNVLQWTGLAVAVGACSALPWIRGGQGTLTDDEAAIAAAPAEAVIVDVTPIADPAAATEGVLFDEIVLSRTVDLPPLLDKIAPNASSEPADAR
ncbi:DMT family transporter [Rhodococcus sp. BP-252]|uniref:DMT family transporter n=1 Tax=unclassified Rhodococcus (in: high G+C Gram-positive bacteria) TaxID=192944 RepID=UPI001C9A6B43|nr:DMT family transporter [Rhodococcus sp. BP-320]MBY6416776.1 DMT family transporter [Rhodococcus sp. BP-321]MBY6421035.1 DMT family transporter [Rhodococcus sp. BP-324]MBY6426800.1 DMT family transporter [Rhodococcus sp. BP-323]MBY6431799.1 DMT family transporter [Rhodococcus sp. BP-322]MBY6440584.1 DMT family transporter [Rhodococcus sp. BP-319]MBY6445898.1 DMT family transporter [Rhodococcus sp. BP-318]MBY6450713.1 DMT family transporter [Rhodococcus sp. BP-315]MBY6455478.1 DMT family t